MSAGTFELQYCVSLAENRIKDAVEDMMPSPISAKAVIIVVRAVREV